MDTKLRNRPRQSSIQGQITVSIHLIDEKGVDFALNDHLAKKLDKNQNHILQKRLESRQNTALELEMEGGGSFPSILSEADLPALASTTVQRIQNKLDVTSKSTVPGRLSSGSKKWNYDDDRRLRELVLFDNEFDWEILAAALEASRSQTIRRWHESIYPFMKVSSKIAGALKWSTEEDSILLAAHKRLGPDWQAILAFLPTRSVYSIEGRWRRLIKLPPGVSLQKAKLDKEGPVPGLDMSKYTYRKQVIKLMGARLEHPELRDTTKLEFFGKQPAFKR